MTQKPSEKLVPTLLQSIDPRTIADSEVRQTDLCVAKPHRATKLKGHHEGRWVSAFLSILAISPTGIAEGIAFLKLKTFHRWGQLFGRSLLLILLVGHGCFNNPYPEILRGYVLNIFS